MKKKAFISKKAQKHSNRGDFYYPRKYRPAKVLTMKSGGHGQDNIDFLSKKNIGYDIDTSFSNGVRLGHVDKHQKKRDQRKNGHSWFPEDWKTDDIRKAGQHVASLKRNHPLIDGQRHTGRYKGVTVGIISRANRIQTIFPFFDVNKHAIKKAHITRKK
ncbi:MAG: EndoU domain-containing protein [Clostridia bacterium]|nr:EndoU domain-containing protein [Clostridia bacterium]